MSFIAGATMWWVPRRWDWEGIGDEDKGPKTIVLGDWTRQKVSDEEVGFELERDDGVEWEKEKLE